MDGQSHHQQQRRRRLVRNLCLLLPCALLITLLSFAVLYYSPGNAAAFLARDKFARQNITEEQAEDYGRKLGLNRSFGELYLSWMKGILTLDFGRSLADGEPALQAVWAKYKITLQLALLSMLFEALFAIPIALSAGLKPGGLADRAVSLWSVLTLAVPSFWLALIMAWFLSVKLHWKYTLGYSGLLSLIVPALIMGLLSGGHLMRLVRRQSREVLMSPFIDLALAQGLSKPDILFFHVLPHVLPLCISILMIDISSFIGGAILVESIFNIPGLSRVLDRAIRLKDFTVLSTTLLITGLLVSGLNLAADVINPKLDGRNRSELQLRPLKERKAGR